MTRQVVSSPWPVWGTAGSRVLLAAGWGGRGLDHRCLWQSDPPCGCTPVGEKSTLRLVLFWEFLIKLNNLTWQTNAAYAIKKTPKNLLTLGSSGGSYCTIQSTSGMSSPRAATSVHSRMPESALQNWKKVVVRLVCFCLPCEMIQSKGTLRTAAAAGQHLLTVTLQISKDKIKQKKNHLLLTSANLFFTGTTKEL